MLTSNISLASIKSIWIFLDLSNWRARFFETVFHWLDIRTLPHLPSLLVLPFGLQVFKFFTRYCLPLFLEKSICRNYFIRLPKRISFTYLKLRAAESDQNTSYIQEIRKWTSRYSIWMVFLHFSACNLISKNSFKLEAKQTGEMQLL